MLLRSFKPLMLLSTAVGLAACGGVRMPSLPSLPSIPSLPPLPGTGPDPSSPARGKMTPRSGLEVVGAMRRAHPSRTLKSIAFTVATTDLRGTAARSETAREVAALPGRYHVTTLPAGRRTGLVRNEQQVAVFRGGKRIISQSRVDLARLLAFDLFAQGIDSTIRWLDVARVRFGLMRRDEFAGRDVWVVGAEEGDSTSTQFWVDADRWHVLRVIQRDPVAPSDIVDIRFSDFTEVLEIPVPTRIQLYRKGKLQQEQVISNVAANPEIPPRSFDVVRWREVKVAN